MNNIIIMAAGASSRMKKTLNEVDLSTEVKELAKQEHKTLIPLKFTFKCLSTLDTVIEKPHWGESGVPFINKQTSFFCI